MARGGQYLDGTETVARVFRGLSDKAVAKITQALNQGAAEIAARAKMLAPYDTGELRSAIEVRDSLEGFTAGGAVGNFGRSVGTKGGGVKRFVGVFPKKRGDPGWYGAFVEFGTRARVAGTASVVKGRRRKASDTNKGRAATPFLFPAYWSVRRKVRSRVARAIREAAREVAASRGAGG